MNVLLAIVALESEVFTSIAPSPPEFATKMHPLMNALLPSEITIPPGPNVAALLTKRLPTISGLLADVQIAPAHSTKRQLAIRELEDDR